MACSPNIAAIIGALLELSLTETSVSHTVSALTRARSCADARLACYHCGDALPAGVQLYVDTEKGPEPVCCSGCQAVAHTILGNGLADYYRYRERTAARATMAREAFALYDDPAVQRDFVRTLDPHILEASLMLDGVRCAACVWLNEQHLRRLPGVLSVAINYTTERVFVRWDDRLLTLSAILRAVADIGYRAFPFDARVREQHAEAQRKRSLRRIFVAGIGMMQVMMYAVPVYLANGDMTADIEQLMRVASLLLTSPVVLYAAQPFYVSAWREIRTTHLGMDTPVALGIGAAFAASLLATFLGRGEVYFDSVTMFAFFLLVGRHLEARMRRLAAGQLESATRALPAAAIRLPAYPAERTQESVAAAALRAGDHVLLRPGDTVPADGVVVEGASEVNEALLSGESAPVAKRSGAALIAGAVNVVSPLIMRVDRVGPRTVLSALALMAERAVGQRPRIARVADRVAGGFVFTLIALTVAVGGAWLWIAPEKAFATVVALLVVSCPCALSLAAPAALASGTARLLREGLLVTRPDAIESLARATHFVFDKTGTLTKGDMRLSAVTPLADLPGARCLAIAQALQQGSEHAIARAIRAAPVPSSDHPLPAARLSNMAGRGVEGDVEGVTYRIGSAKFVSDLAANGNSRDMPQDGATVVMLGSAQGRLARFVLNDSPRPEAGALIGALQAMGKEVILLSGDAQAPVRDMAARLGIVSAHAGMTPPCKLDFVRALQRKGAVVAMIGDGINDAPVLAGADVSVALGSGTALAQIHADIVMMAPQLTALHASVMTARRVLRTIKQNLAWAFIYNFTAIPLAAFGLVSPWMAAIGMSASSLIVLLNALRLSGRPPRQARTANRAGEAPSHHEREREHEGHALASREHHLARPYLARASSPTSGGGAVFDGQEWKSSTS
jgi:P-type Cu2+ transporter